MKSLHRFFKFYINASIHVAFGVYALTHITIETFHFQRDEHLAWFLFFGTIACYNFIKYGVEAEKYIIVANPYHKSIQLASFIAIFISLYHAYFLNLNIWIAILFLVVLTGLYAIPVLPKMQNLRNLGGLKIFIVALVWSGATVILPCLGANETITWDVWIESFQRILFVLVLILPFEVRDLKYDSPELKTLPQRIGVRGTKFMGSILVFLFYLTTFLKDEISESEIWVKSILFLVLEILMFSFGKNQGKYFASFWVEGIPIVWYFLILIIELI